MKDGLGRHGIEVEFFKNAPPPADIVVVWGWRKGRSYHQEGRTVLVMERGFLGDRFKYTSLGWNGLNGRATWNPPADTGQRFARHFGHLVRPWSFRRSGPALIIGQVPGDASLINVDIESWYREAASALRKRGFDIVFRQHPRATERGMQTGRLDADRSDLPLEEDLRRAAVVVTFNSNTGVDAALRGVPVIACDEGSMAWPVAARGLDANLVMPDRWEWLTALSWRQWTMEEISSGEAWEHIAAPVLTMAA